MPCTPSVQSKGEEQVVKFVRSVTLQLKVVNSAKAIGGKRVSLKALYTGVIGQSKGRSSSSAHHSCFGRGLTL